MKKVERYLVLAGIFFLQPALADSYAPDDTYLVCGNYLVAIETTLEQRLFKNRNRDQDQRGALIMYDIETLKEGETASYPKATWEGRAYKERFSLHAANDNHTIDRLSGALSVYTETVKEDCDPTWIYPAYDLCVKRNREKPRGTWEELEICQKSTQRNLKIMVDKHNQSVGGLKF